MKQAGNHSALLDLLEGEEIERTITRNSRSARSSGRGGESLLLTSSRIVCVTGSGNGADLVMADVDDVDAVQFIEVTEGYGAFVWAALSVALSVALYSILENQIAKVVVPLLVLGMGVYLIVYRLFFSGGPAAMFRTGGSAITWPFKGEDEAHEIREFISELYRLKSDRKVGTAGPFAPR